MTMSKVKPYNVEDAEKSPIVAEPAVAYGTSINSVQTLRDRIVDAVNQTDDKSRLTECLETLCATAMPCVYTDEEFELLLQKALKGPFVSSDEVEKIFEKWDC